MTQDTIKQRLRAARALIDQPEKWTQNKLARQVNGGMVARCVDGAILSVCLDGEQQETREYLGDSINGKGRLQLSEWNDAPERTHADVMLAFDRAIGESP